MRGVTICVQVATLRLRRLERPHRYSLLFRGISGHTLGARGPWLGFPETRPLDFLFVFAVGLLAGAISGIVGTGSSIMLMPQVPHAFANVSDTGKLMIAFQPAGTMEKFFHDGSLIKDPTPSVMQELYRAHNESPAFNRKVSAPT
jgi:hypothetical protein